MRRVCFVGAGFISHVHAEAVASLPDVRLHGVIDTNADAARALSKRWKIPHVFASAGEALASREIDCVHVLTPPPLHAESALPFLRAGIPALLEKPIAVSSAECETLNAAARENGAVLGVNQNFVYHPAFLRLRRLLEKNQLGRPKFVTCHYNVSLRQLAARQFGHWMFHKPVNMLLEQAVHPLSQIAALAGRIAHVSALAEPPIEISPGVPLYRSVSLSLGGSAIPAQLRMAVGQSFPFWQLSVLCDDGAAVADILNNRFFTYRRGPWLEAVDAFFSGAKTGLSILGDGFSSALDFGLSTVKIKPRSDGFFRSMKDSIGAFHKALDEGRAPETDGAFATHLVDLCERTANSAFTAPLTPKTAKVEGEYDIAVIGGTGFIGVHLVKRLLAAGRRVGVMARNTRNLAPEFYDERVVLRRGDVRSPSDVEAAIGNAPLVVNLAHGGGGGSFEEIRSAMVDSAETVARVCLARGVERLVHVGSIASLYLGPQQGKVTDSTPPDPKSRLRADYARAKAECDRMLLDLHRAEGLALCILRPGIVVGEGGTPMHSGLGFFNNEQHCIGWNRGTNPLPFVLVEDVAEAIWRACSAPKAIGRAYNIVGDVRLSARAYLAELSAALSRPLRFHPQSPLRLWLEESAKWLVKRAAGRKAARPTYRDLRSRGLVAEIDCTEAKEDLDWHPESDRTQFVQRGIRVFAET